MDEREEGELQDDGVLEGLDAQGDGGASVPMEEGVSEALQPDAQGDCDTATAAAWHGPAALDFTSPPVCIRQATAHFKDAENFTKGVKFSPDGTCLLTASEDNVIRVFEVPSDVLYQQHSEQQEEKEAAVKEPSEWPCVIESREGETIYDFAWYPLMQPSEPASCCYLSTSRDHPIHLWDAFTGQLRASYRAYDHMDELAAAYCVAFSPYGDKIFAGFNRTIRIFDTSIPGRVYQTRSLSKTKRSRVGQRGIISCLAFSPDATGMYVAGSYAGSIGVYDDRAAGEGLMELTGHEGGVTCVKISPDSRLLFSGARKDPLIYCWDLRKTGQALSTFKRDASTNQRMGLDVDVTGRYLMTGSRDSRALVYDLTTGECISTLTDVDAVNDVAFHPYAPVVALGTGQRHFDLHTAAPGDEDRTDELDDEADNVAGGHVEGRNTVRLLQVKQQRPEVAGAEETVAMD